jgi:hypothetical protein
MNENTVKAVFRTLSARFPGRCSMVPPGCLIFKGETIRVTPGRVRLRSQSLICKTPEDLLKAMARKGLLRLRNINKLINEANNNLSINK